MHLTQQGVRSTPGVIHLTQQAVRSTPEVIHLTQQIIRSTPTLMQKTPLSMQRTPSQHITKFSTSTKKQIIRANNFNNQCLILQSDQDTYLETLVSGKTLRLLLRQLADRNDTQLKDFTQGGVGLTKPPTNPSPKLTH